MPTQYDQSYTDYQLKRSGLRRMVRRHYLRSALSLTAGRTLDMGCGVGELLSLLPAGSEGLEYNLTTVQHCQRIGLPVRWYDGFSDDWRLTPMRERGAFASLVLSHVLEHFDKPLDVLAPLLTSATELGIHRVVVIVPGKAGFASDPTHRTFIDKNWLTQALSALPGWRLTQARHFPLNSSAAGDLFTHNELQAVFDRSPAIADPISKPAG